MHENAIHILRIAFKIVVVLFVGSSSAQDDENFCPNTKDENISWPDTKGSTCTVSHPLCINTKMEVTPRCCDPEGGWQSSPSCFLVQGSIDSPCPQNVTYWSESVCIIAIEGSTYPPQCPFEETLPFYDYIEDVDSTVLPVWMPVMRNTGKYGIGLLHWLDPTQDYGSFYMSCGDHTCQNYGFSDSIVDKNCLVFHNKSYIEAVACDQRYTAICAYRSLPSRTNSFCSQNYPHCMQSDYSTRSKCFCVASAGITSKDIAAEFVEPYQNLIHPSLTQDTCYIGLERDSQGSYLWVNRNQSIKYTYWSEDATFGEEYIFGAISKAGWIMAKTRNEATCDLYEIEAPIRENVIFLDYDENQKQFTVNLTNPKNWIYNDEQTLPLVFCFTDAIQDALVTKMEVTGSVMTDYALFSFQPHSDGPGTYWCEAFPYPETSTLRSNEYLLRYTDSFSEEYVVVLKTSYVRGSNPLTEANMKSIRENLARQLDTLQTDSSFYPRIYKIVDVDEVNSEMTINFHVVNPQESEPLQQYITLRGYLEQNLTNFTFVNMFGMDQCVGIQTGVSPDIATWPETDVGNIVLKPREGYCVKSDGSIMSRKCSGDYINGARWEELEEPCIIQKSTNITVNLTNIVELNQSQEYIQQVVEIVTNHYKELLPMDVHLISLFLQQIAESEAEINLNATIDIIDKLMDVPQHVLKESQMLFNATDRILYYIDRIIENSNFIGDILEENLMIISYFVREANLSGAVINNADEISYTLYKMFNEFDLENVMKDENLKAAIVLSEELLAQMLKSNQPTKTDISRIIITVFKNSNLFNELTDKMVTTSVIIGVLFPDMKEDFSGNVFTIHNDFGDDKEFSCSYWKYDLGEKKGVWESEQVTDYKQSSIICSYDHLTHLAVARKTDINVTIELEKILASSMTLPEKLQNSSQLMEQHLDKFKPEDVMLLSRLFQEVTTSGEDNIELVADILDKIIEIQPSILRKSQELYNATGKILVYFEKILEQSESSMSIQRNHFYAIVQLLKDDSVFGFTISNCHAQCNLTLLHEDSVKDDISKTENLNIALMLDYILIQQLLDFKKDNYSPKLILTIFLTDALFIGDNEDVEITSIIVGLSLPNFDDSLNSGINLLYTVDQNFSSNYTCSIYSNDADENTVQKGFWNQDSPPTILQNLLECQFWNPKYFALMHSLINFTSSLEKMLESGQAVLTILENADLIVTSYHFYLNQADVYLISQILAKVEEVDNHVLELCLRIVSYTMYISKDILKESQEKSQATDLILFHIQRIASKIDQSVILHEDNIVLVVSLMAASGVRGLGLEKCDYRCIITLLYGEEPPDVTEFDAVLQINSNLASQMLENKLQDYVPKLVSIIFYSNSLFNEKANVSTDKIFGVYFPEFDEVYSREFKLYFRADMSHNYSCFNWHYQVDDNFNTTKGFWSYDSRARADTMLSCNFYSGGYFTLLGSENNYENISQTVTDLVDAKTSFSEKLYRVEDTLYYYWEFLPPDVLLLSEIFAQCNHLYDDEVDRINGIINNILRIPRDVLTQSEDDFDALRQLLSAINNMASFAGIHQHTPIQGRFGLVICEVNSTSSMVGVTVTQHEISCFANKTENYFDSPEYTIAGLTLSKEALDQAMVEGNATKIVVVVLLDNTFFNEKENRTTGVILGMSIPDLEETIDGGIIALFSNHVYNDSNYSCAHWNLCSSDSWAIQSDRMRTESFTECSFKQGSYLTLVQTPDVDDVGLTQMLLMIIDGDYTPTEKLSQTQDLITFYSSIFQSLHIFYVSEILSHVVDVNIDDLEKTAGIASNITRVDREVLAESQMKYNATDWILYHVDRISAKFGQKAKVVTENLVLLITDNINGVAIKNCNETCEVVILEEDSLDNQENLNTALMLGPELQSQLESSSSLLVITIYFNDALFNEGYNNTSKNVGEIIGVIIPSLEVETVGSLKFYYYTEVDRTEICAFWNYSVNDNSITRGHWERDKTALQPSKVLVCESNRATHFALLEAEANVTNDLENILNSNKTTAQKLEELVNITTSSSQQLSSIDIYLIAQILDYALENMGPEEMILTSHIVSSLFNVPRDILRDSQTTYNATDRILHSIDEMTKIVDQSEAKPIVQEYFVIAVYDLKKTNTSGLILEGCSATECNITTLENNANLSEIVQNENLNTAVVLSDPLLYQIRNTKGSPKLVTTIFFTDDLFNEESKRNGSVSMVFGLLILGLEAAFNGSIYLLYNTIDQVDQRNSCAFWNYNVSGEEVSRGFWKADGTPTTKDHFTICDFQHTTHFALLLANNNSTFTDVDQILDIMTIVNCVLSLIGILGILLTAAIFERWRRNTGNQILVHFVIAISIKIVMLYVSVAVYSSKVADVGCSVTGAILHYAILSEFCWMLIIAILQFKRFVEVLGGPPKYILLKACICGWVFPLLPVTLILIIDTDNYNEGQVGLCYPSGLGLYLGIWLPLIIIVAINFVIFVFIIYNVFHKKTESRDLVNHEILFQWRLALLLFSMLGLTWLFGFLGQIDGATIFVYLFCFTSTLQGFIMFLFFIVFNQSTRFLYAQAIKLWLYTKGYKVP